MQVRVMNDFNQTSSPKSDCSTSLLSLSSSPALISHLHGGCSEENLNNNVCIINKLNSSKSVAIPSKLDRYDDFQVGSLDTNKSFLEEGVKFKSKNSWQRSMSELSKNLQRICGPVPGSPSSIRQAHSLENSPVCLYQHPPIDACFKKESTHGILKTRSISQPSFIALTPTSSKKILQRADTVLESSSQKLIMVRHIETHDKLHSQLLKITSGKRSPTGSPCSRSYLSSSFDSAACSHLKIQEEIYEAPENFEATGDWGCHLNYNASLNHFDVEDLIVEVDKLNSFITVYKASSQYNEKSSAKDRRVLYQCNMEGPIGSCSICLLRKDGYLFLSQQPKCIVQNEYYLSNENFYLPVIKGDDLDQGEYVISVHLPSDLKYEDISVKTVDENLIINVSKRRNSSGITNFDFAKVGCYDSLECSKTCPSQSPKCYDAKQFFISLRLPNIVDTRSVFSYMTNSRQLIIQTYGLMNNRF